MPVIEAALMVTGDVPDDVSVTDCVVDVFTVRLPKLRLVVLTVNCGFAAVAVPVRATTAVLPLVELLLIMSCPVSVPAAVGRNCSCKVTDWLGFNVIGKLPATRVKPAPEIEAEFTVTAEVPDDVSVTEPVAGEFTVTLPKLRVEALSVNCGLAAAVAVPARATTAVLPLVELLLIVSCPVAVPTAVGRNRSCKVIDWLGLNVIGRLPETRVKPAPVIEAEFTVTAEVPDDVSVTEPVAGEFTVTLPKLSVEALSVNWGLAAAVAVPVRATAAVLPLAELLLIVSCPAAVPTAVGRKRSCKVTEWFGLSVTGKLPEAMVKPAPEIEAEFTVNAEVPDDVSVTEPVAEESTVTLPKLRAEALSVNSGRRSRPCLANALLAEVTNINPQTNARRRTLHRPLSRGNPAMTQEHAPFFSED